MMLEGLRLMALGMTMVFVFLALLVLLMHGSGRVLRSFGQRYPEPAALPAAVPAVSPLAPASPSDDGARIAAAIAAIHRHRARRK
jgi:oxaloacetate decarboxylase (Na+ extruding) subunit gamma